MATYWVIGGSGFVVVPTSGVSGASWGTITGSLISQVDLKNAFQSMGGFWTLDKSGSSSPANGVFGFAGRSANFYFNTQDLEGIGWDGIAGLQGIAMVGLTSGWFCNFNVNSFANSGSIISGFAVAPNVTFPENFAAMIDGETIRVTFITTATITKDTGWSANFDAGDKTAIIPTMPDTSALDALSSGFSAWAVAMDKKVKANETALTNSLLANA